MAVRVYLPDQGKTYGFTSRDAALAWLEQLRKRAPGVEFEILDASDAK